MAEAEVSYLRGKKNRTMMLATKKTSNNRLNLSSKAHGRNYSSHQQLNIDAVAQQRRPVAKTAACACLRTPFDNVLS